MQQSFMTKAPFTPEPRHRKNRNARQRTAPCVVCML